MKICECSKCGANISSKAWSGGKEIIDENDDIIVLAKFGGYKTVKISTGVYHQKPFCAKCYGERPSVPAYGVMSGKFLTQE